MADGGSGVDTVTPRMNGNTMLAGAGLPSGRAILLLTALPLGDHTFTVDADDHVDNVSPTKSVTFSIVAPPPGVDRPRIVAVKVCTSENHSSPRPARVVL